MKEKPPTPKRTFMLNGVEFAESEINKLIDSMYVLEGCIETDLVCKLTEARDKE